MRLFEVWQACQENAAWILLNHPKIISLMSDMARLSKLVQGLAYMDMLTAMARDLALLKDRANLPDSYTAYGADNFLDPDESDTANTEYHARVEEGIRFPWAGLTEQQPALFNPYASEVENFNGLVLPAHEDVVRLDVTRSFAGALSIGQYQYQTHEMRLGYRTVQRVRYGPTREVCTNGANWGNGTYDAAANVFEAEGQQYQVVDRYGEHGGHVWYRVQAYWVDTITVPYWYQVTINHTIQGSQIAQTFLNAQNGWLKSIDLWFEKVAADGICYLHLCETDLGLPDPSRCLGSTQVEAANLKKRSQGGVAFAFEQPVFLEAGKRYALLLTTAGDHQVSTVQGTEYTHGTLFYSTDGAYHQGDFTKDLMMRFHYCQVQQRAHRGGVGHHQPGRGHSGPGLAGRIHCARVHPTDHRVSERRRQRLVSPGARNRRPAPGPAGHAASAGGVRGHPGSHARPVPVRFAPARRPAGHHLQAHQHDPDPGDPQRKHRRDPAPGGLGRHQALLHGQADSRGEHLHP